MGNGVYAAVCGSMHGVVNPSVVIGVELGLVVVDGGSGDGERCRVGGGSLRWG